MAIRLFILLFLAVLSINCNAQSDPYEYIGLVTEKLITGDCDAAQKFYNVYKGLTGVTNKSIESSIMECKGIPVQEQYVDLGLPSGTLWKEQNEPGYYTYDEAVGRYGDRLPSIKMLEELEVLCKWVWIDSAYLVTGPNGNSIVLNAAGYHLCDGEIIEGGNDGRYWSSTPDRENLDEAWFLDIGSDGVSEASYGRCRKYSVRLTQKASQSEASSYIALSQKCLDSGDCNLAKRYYKVYKELTGLRNALLESEIRKCNGVEDTLQGYVDLGLPSGTLWKANNEPGFYTHDEAIALFVGKLPTKEMLEELKSSCKWQWAGDGYRVTGPNGNSIVLPALGYRDSEGSIHRVGDGGYYWSSYSWSLNFWSNDVDIDEYIRSNGFSVRLVQD